MKKTNILKSKAFTLIEVLIVIMILGMMLTATYAPYSHYQKKALLKQSVKEITQSIYEARNLAINGLNFGTGAITDYENVSVGIFMDNTTDVSKRKLTYYSYPHDTNTSTINPSVLPTSRIIKSKDLPNSVQLEKIRGENQFFFLYDAINGEGRYYAGLAGVLTEITDTEVDINVSYKGATTSTLQKEIIYYTDTYIADY